MQRTLDEYRRERALTQRPSQAPQQQLHVSVRAAVRMEALTHDEDWDFFLAYIEAEVQRSEAELAQADATLRAPLLVNDEAIRVLKAHITRAEARIAALKEVLLLPAFIKKNGALARAQIAEMTRDAAPGA